MWYAVNVWDCFLGAIFIVERLFCLILYITCFFGTGKRQNEKKNQSPILKYQSITTVYNFLITDNILDKMHLEYVKYIYI